MPWKDVFIGEWARTKSKQFRQVNAAINVIEAARTKHPINPKLNENHEKAHIAGSKAGKSGRMRASLEIDNEGNATSWRLIQELHPSEPLEAKELVRSALAPLFVRKLSHKTLPSDKDMINAVIGGPVIAITNWLQRKK